MRMPRSALLLGLAPFTFGAPLAAQEITLRLAPDLTGSSTLTSTLSSFINELRANEALGGLIEVETVAISGPDLLEAVRKGVIDIGLVMTSEIESERHTIGTQPVAMFNQPLVFTGLDEVGFVQTSWLGDAALSELASADLLGLAFWNAGSTQFATNDAIYNLDDLVGRKILTTSSAGLDALHDLGASPVALGQNDLYPALLTGVADTAEVSTEFAPMLEGAFTYLIELDYRPLVAVLLANRETWYKLPEQARLTIGELARKAGVRSTEFAARARKEAPEKLQAQNVTLIQLDRNERERIRELSFEALDTEPEKIIDYIEDAIYLIRARGEDRRNSGDLERRGEVEVEILFATDRNDERKLFPNAALEQRYWLGSRLIPGEPIAAR